MIQQAYTEWHTANEQKKVKIAMMSNMKKGLLDMINKQKALIAKNGQGPTTQLTSFGSNTSNKGNKVEPQVMQPSTTIGGGDIENSQLNLLQDREETNTNFKEQTQKLE